MWPLSIFLFVATAAPQQQQLNVFQDFRGLKLPAMQHRQLQDHATSRKLIDESQRNTCLHHAQLFLPPPGWPGACACRHDNLHTRQRPATKTGIAPPEC